MLYRVAIRAVPIALVAGLVTGCGQVAAVSPPDDGRPVGILAEFQKDEGEAPPKRVAKDGAMAPTPQAASELFDAIDADLDAEIKRRAPEEKARKQRLERERLGDWAPKAGGWGN
ncbi:MAG TPA: hypothetical protein VEZ41_14570 [Allosphingosinicella sp.]|jgi:hypothetical protein|nr:hypothetical protein [Allosphingosinicella sp.]